MGNCFSLKQKKKELDRDHPTVSRWLASCDFSSVPDVDDFSTEEGDLDGYITALENLESEEGDGTGDTVEELAQSSCDDIQQEHDLYMQLDEESVYETSDEQGPYEMEKSSDVSVSVKELGLLAQNLRVTPDQNHSWQEEDDVVDELTEEENHRKRKEFFTHRGGY
ncbi:hypothetical protein COOONC_18425 [Cooperia oncophora]